MKKVLIISHNPISAQSNMGKTFLSLFSGMPKEALCQLYIYPTIPNLDRCNGYYRITDKEVLNRVIKGKKAGGRILPEQIRQDRGIFEDPSDEALYRSRKNKSALRRLLRDALWRLARWYSKDLQRWLEHEQPECIFVAPGVAKFLYDIALKIAKDRKIPIVTYICDEYYFVKTPAFGLDRLRLRLLQSKIRQLIHGSAHLVVISEELRKAYQAEFGVPTSVLMTGASHIMAEGVKRVPEPTSICYFGNVRCNRFISLGQIAEELDCINGERGKEYKLKIYSPEKNEEILAHLAQYSAIELCGFVTGNAYEEAFGQAQLLLHTEAFDAASIDFVQHSVSTKIADSLASGIPLLAYGPEQISSMQHLIRNQCAITATSRSQLHAMLDAAFSEAERRETVAANALRTAAKYHNSERVSAHLQSILSEAE